MGTRLVALYLMLTGLAVAVYFIAVSWQYSGADQPYPVEPYPAWEVLHWFMAAAILIALASTFARKRQLGPGGALREHLSVNALFYALLGLALIFFRSGRPCSGEANRTCWSGAPSTWSCRWSSPPPVYGCGGEAALRSVDRCGCS